MNKKYFLIDAHAHIQDCYNIKDYFYSVYKNFSDIANRESISNGWIGVLFLTEVKELNFFNKLKSQGINKSLEDDDLCFTKTSEDSSIILSVFVWASTDAIAAILIISLTELFTCRM